MSKFRALALGLALAAPGLASGQDVQTTETRTTTTGPGGPTTEVRRVSQVIGSSIQLQGGESYGKVEDFVFNDDGCIDYVVVNRDDRYALMPWSMANVNWGRRVVTYDVAPAAVQPLFFARDAWPKVTDPAFGQRMTKAFGSRAVRRQVLRPAPDAPPGAGVPPVVPPPGPDGPDKVKIKEKRNGDVKVKVKD